MKKIVFFFLIMATLLVGLRNKTIGQQVKAKKTNVLPETGGQIFDTTVFRQLIDKYKQSIENADTVLASKIWAHTDEVSFIHPRGHEHGWQEIKNDIYIFFADNFTTRKLNSFNEKVAVYNGVAWVEFYWVFNGTFKNSGGPLQTKGRETQIWKKIHDEWALVHVHYSNMPLTQPRQGF
jgi:ketosteroid isomerase-like protein